ncbi:MAG: RluA family pseudouridine synthase [Deltaproteobacteria bacterium]|nr:RluA family pseudouridine synthase [Deltaproteobacteria bacterium]
MPEEGGFTIKTVEADSEKRLDSLIADQISCCSRKLAASLIRKGLIRVSGSVKKPGYRIRAGDIIEGVIPEPETISFQPEPVELDILFEDEHVIILNKAPGIVVHPSPGHYTGTIVNGLLYHCPDLEGIGGEIRPGIVHRLDKDTSGVLAVAKSHAAHLHLAAQFKSRNITKSYLAIVYGDFQEDSGVINLPIGRHPSDRKKMSIHSRKTRVAETHWKIRERFEGITLLDLEIKTGRTHQIRVHCTAIQHPIVGDPVYGSRRAAQRIRLLKDRGALLKNISRQMLHARRLSIKHPMTDQRVSFEAPLPEDMVELIRNLKEFKR